MKSIDYNNKSTLILKSFKTIPFHFSPGWAEYQILKGREIKYFINNPENLQIIAIGYYKKLLGASFLIIENITFFTVNITSKEIKLFFIDLIKYSNSNIILNSSIIYQELYEVGIREAGFKRPFGMKNTNLSVFVELNNFNPNRSWKNNIAKANKNNLKFIEVNSNNEKNINDFVLLFTENKIEKKLNYSLSKEEVRAILKDKNMHLFFIENANKKRLSGRIIYINNHTAFDIFAANGHLSRNTGASYLIMDNIFKFLQSKNILYFDFSRIPVGKIGAEGVAMFKLATKGKIIQYFGEWCYFKRNIFKDLYFLYNRYYLKKDLY